MGGGPALGGSGILRQLEDGAVLPQPLQGVEDPLLRVLHVHDDVHVVQEDPAALALPLAADGLDAEVLQQPLLDPVQAVRCGSANGSTNPSL